MLSLCSFEKRCTGVGGATIEFFVPPIVLLNVVHLRSDTKGAFCRASEGLTLRTICGTVRLRTSAHFSNFDV